MATHNPLITATAEHLARFVPFDSMTEEDLVWLANRLKLGYFAKGEVLFAPEQGVLTKMMILKQGLVVGERGEAGAWLELHEGEAFPLGSLVSGQPVTSTFRARGDVFVYELSADDFRALLKRSQPFAEFCTERIATLLHKSQRSIQAVYAASSSDQQSLRSPLSELARRAPVTCRPDTPLREALERIRDNRISAIVIVDEAMHPVGVFSVRDLIGRIILPGTPLDTPMEAVMTPNPMTLPPSAHAFEAALMMARHGFRHVLVAEAGKLTGVVSEKDLFSLQRVGVTQVSATIRAAASFDALKQAALDIRQLVHNMMAQGVAAEQLSQIVSTLNDLLTQRVIELECGDKCPYTHCWLAFGSEGRLEQTLTADQDNGFIFVVPDGANPEAVRREMLALAARINAALDACGLTSCRRGIMASNPEWCLTLGEWKATFSRWLEAETPETLIDVDAFFDFRPLHGASDLADELRRWLTDKARQSPRFLAQMANNALLHRPPLGVVRDFVVESAKGEHPHTLDLRVNGAQPFVDTARVLALAAGVEATSTAARLRAAAGPMKIPASEVEAWISGFFFIQLLRLRVQHEESLAGEALDNHIDPDRLNDLDRRILKEAFRQARKIQSRLAQDYKA